MNQYVWECEGVYTTLTSENDAEAIGACVIRLKTSGQLYKDGQLMLAFSRTGRFTTIQS